VSGFAADWYRVAPLRPRLRAHADVHRHRYRNRLWYVLQDRQSGRFFRISPAANLMLCLMDGRRTMEEIWRLAGARLGAERPSRADTLGLLAQLHQADLLLAGLPPDMAELERRAGRQQRNPVLTLLRNPMAMRFPLLDPDRFLDRTMPLARLLFSRAGLAVWFALVAAGITLAALHWPELVSGISDRVFSTQNVLILALVYPTVKAVHELAHAYTTKVGGGEVHEIGLMLLLLFPVPYVDASASSALPGRWQRAGVAAAGVMVELALAALAMIAWTRLGPGLPRAVAFNVMLLSGVTTVLFNANPLLRFDGYYVVSDLLEIPNLDARAKRYLLYLMQRHLLGLESAESPVQADGERFWFVLYGIAALIYRLVLMFGIALVIASKFFAVGVALALVALTQMIAVPAVRGVRYLATGIPLRRRRRRALAGTLAALAVVLVLLFVVPLPHGTMATGVVWVPEEAALRAGADGVVGRLLAAPDSEVAAGTRVIAMEDPVAAAQVEVDRADVAVLQSRFLAVNLLDRAQALLINDALARARARLEDAERRVAELDVTATRAGRFVVTDATHLPGRFVHKGALLAYVIGADDADVRVVVPQAQIDLVRRDTVSVSIRFTERLGTALAARIVRETPSALDRVPAAGLSADGGGPMLLDPSSQEHDRPLERFYEIELRPEAHVPLARIGSHAFVRFEYPAEPPAWRLLRSLRQLLLQRLAT
jgi:putative peptide zinc metalloprotease protein